MPDLRPSAKRGLIRPPSPQSSAPLPTSPEADALARAAALYTFEEENEGRASSRRPCNLGKFPPARQLPAQDVLENLPIFRCQTRASFRSRAARALRLFRRLFRSSASDDHQMTPTWFRPLLRACALSRPSLAERLSGTPSAALRPKASHCAGLRGELSNVEKHAACLDSEL